MTTESDWKIMLRGRGSRRRLALVAGALAVLATTACEPLPTTLPPSNVIKSGAVLASGTSLASPSGRFKLVMQGDGNLVERSPSGRSLWTTKTPGNAAAKLVMRSDGVLLVQTTAGKTVWSTPTSGVRGATANFGDDGNFVVKGTAGQPVWANGMSAAPATRAPISERHTSPQQVTLTKMYEGLVATTPYYNAYGNCTVGYGHLIRLGACTSADKAKKWDADALFAADVVEHENRLKSSLGSVPVTQREFDTLWDYVFGHGSITAKTSPKMYAAMSASPPRYVDVPPILRENGDTLLRGLCYRRYDEADVFTGGFYDRNATSACS